MGFPIQHDAGFAPIPRARMARHHFMMYTPRAQAAFEHQQFFFEQKEKLAALLNTLGQDAKLAPLGSEVGNDYHELTTVVTQLLDEAQVASGFTLDQIERSGLVMQPFAENVQLVEQVAASARERAAAAAAATKAPVVSRKRGRGRDEEEDEEMLFEYKRYRHNTVDHDMMMVESAYCGPYAEQFLETAWWTEPICQ
jgi:hypothetical protein